MSNRWVRLLLVVLAIAAAAGAAYRVVQDEQGLARDSVQTRAAEQASENALLTLVDLKATLHAYVAPGQGLPFWTTRAATLIDQLRGGVLALDTASTLRLGSGQALRLSPGQAPRPDAAQAASGPPLTQALDTCDRLAAAEQRARDHMRAGQALLAGDVIFTEVRDLVDGLQVQIAHARDQIATASGARLTQVRREQTWLLAGGVGALALVMLLLLPVSAHAAPSARDAGASPAEPVDSPPLAQRAAERLAAPKPPQTYPGGDRPAAPKPPQTYPGGEGGTPDLSATASICVDLARVADSTELSGLLSRTAAVLHATGIIVWVSSQDRLELFPVASTGYDEKMFSRIGSISREASNLTAAAFRDAVTRVANATATSPSALAIPLAGPQGPVGVLSAEFRGGAASVDAARVAVSEIFAAQLATLIGSLPAADNTPHEAQA